MSDILCVTPTLGTTRVEWGLMLRSQRMPLGLNIMFSAVQGEEIANARNLAMTEAIKRGIQYLMFYDDDILPREPKNLAMMLDTIKQQEVDICGAVYPARLRGHPEPIVVKKLGDGPWWGWQDGNLHKVYMTGTGFTIFDMGRIFPHLPEQYHVTSKQKNPDTGENEEWDLYKFFDFVDYQTGSDDFYLAEYAEKNGLNWYVHGGIMCDQVDRDGFVYRVEDAEPRAKIVKDDEDE